MAQRSSLSGRSPSANQETGKNQIIEDDSDISQALKNEELQLKSKKNTGPPLQTA